jgi:uncharacterized protein YoxC
MNDFLKQDIFFFITTVAVLVIAFLLGVLLIYVIRIVRTTSYILDKIKAETDIITGELSELRQNIRKEGVRLKHFAKFINAVRKK